MTEVRQMPAVNVIIPNLNGEKLLPICLEALKRQKFQDFDITVVDNGSHDTSIEMLKEQYPAVKILALNRNYGFAFAVNRGIEATDGEFISLLNNDMEVDPKWLGQLHRALVEHPSVGACGPKLLRYWERNRIDLLGIRQNSDGEVEAVGSGEIDEGQYEEMQYVFGLNAGASLYRRRMFEDIGLFDDKFFVTFEDVDLSFRAQLSGYKALYVASAKAYHMRGVTRKRRKYFGTYLHNRNKIIFFWKNMPYEIIRKNFRKIFLRKSRDFSKRVLFNIWKLRTFYFLRGIIAAYILLPYIIRERKKIQSLRRVSIDYLSFCMDRNFI